VGDTLCSSAREGHQEAPVGQQRPNIIKLPAELDEVVPGSGKAVRSAQSGASSSG
jgi:hypothetical protein